MIEKRDIAKWHNRTGLSKVAENFINRIGMGGSGYTVNDKSRPGGTADQLIGSMKLDSLPKVYFVGPYTTRVNFASQQTRALNLVWALTSTNTIRKSSKIAILGAGLAGMTAAVAFKRLGHEVSVYEAKKSGMYPLQRMSSIRYTHPTLNFWPHVKLDAGADFPFFYWTADICSEAISTILRQSKSELVGISIHEDSRVSAFARDDNKNPLLEMEGGAQRGPYDAVIVATGFSPEVHLAGTSACSYWDNEDLAKPSAQTASSFLICGAGDGGLLEILRLTYEDFDNGKLTERVARRLDGTNIENQIRDIENKAQSEVDMSKARSALRHAYLNLKLPDDLPGIIKPLGNLTLLARDGAAFLPTSAPIHRILLARAVQKSAVRVEEGQLEATTNGLFVQSVNARRQVREDVIVKRYGAPRAVENLLNKEQITELSNKQRVLSEYQLEKSWPSEYFSTDEHEEETSRMNARLNTALHTLKELKGAGGLTIQRIKKSKELGYCILTSDNISDFKKQSLPKQLFGRPVEVKQRSFRATSTQFVEGNIIEGRRALRIGDYLRVSAARGPSRQGRIGCFISSETDNQLAALTAEHVVADRSGDSVYARSPLSPDWTFIGHVAHTSKAGEARPWNDVGVIYIDENIEIDPTAMGLKIDRTANPLELIGRQVYRIGNEGQRVRGEVEGLGVNLDVQLPSGVKRSLPNSIIVSSTNNELFSQQGDSGALVFTDMGEAVGVVIASDGNESLITPISETLSDLNATLTVQKRPGKPVIPEESPAPSPPSLIDAAARFDLSELEGFYSTHARLDSLLKLPVGQRELFADHFSEATFPSHQRLLRIYGLNHAFHALHLSQPKDLQRFTSRKHLLRIDLADLGRVAAPKTHGLAVNTIKRAARGETVSLIDAAGILIGVTKAAASQSPPKSSPDHLLTIEPAIFRLRNLTSETRVLSDKFFSSELITQEFRPTLKQLILEMIAGRLVTYATASLLFEIFSRLGLRTGPLEIADRETLQTARAAGSEREILVEGRGRVFLQSMNILPIE